MISGTRISASKCSRPLSATSPGAHYRKPRGILEGGQYMDKFSRAEVQRSLESAAPRRVVLERFRMLAMGVAATLGMTHSVTASGAGVSDAAPQRDPTQSAQTEIPPPPGQVRRGPTGPTGATGPT